MAASVETKKDIAKRSVSAAKYTVVFRVLSQATSLVVTVLLVRALSEHDYGIYNLFYSVICLLGMVASFGLANTLQRYIPEYYSKGEFRIANNLYRIASIIRLLSNVVILGLALIFWEHIAPYLKIVAYKQYFMLFTLIILLYMQRELLETCLGSYFLQKYTQGFSFLFVLIKAIGYALAVMMELDLWFILIIDLIVYSVIFCILQIIYFKKIPAPQGHLQGISTTEKRRLIRYAAFYNFNDTGVGLLDANFDNFIIVMYLNPVAVGAYAFCQRITNMIRGLIPVNYLLDVIRPAFFSLRSDTDTTQINQFYQSLVKINYLFNIPIFFFIAVLGEELIKLFFGGKFLEYSHVLVGVYFFSILNSFQMPAGLVAQLKERADIILYSKVFAVYNLIADIFLIKYFGIWGAVFATGTAVLGKNIFIWYFFRKEASFKGMGGYFLTSICFWMFVSSIVLVVKNFVPDHTMLLITGFVIFAASFGLQFRLRLFNSYERRKLLALAGDNKRIQFLIKVMRIQTA
jgi:O-antigen/teichoic acid export membrane protein